ncbi:ATP-binding protein [Streptomyces sioyaensis]|uniref:ATP-binding protein n=1 Tax=Streptomyces sioyaensis TaxID=67364 RepID=UPI0037A77968
MAEDPNRTPTRQLLFGAVASFLVGWTLWQLLYAGFLGTYWLWPIFVLIPDAWKGTYAFVVSVYAYYALVIGGLAFFFGRLGHWPEVVRRARARVRSLNESEAGPMPTTPPPDADPARWPAVRAAGAAVVADRLTDELHAGRLTDVDHARITRAWSAARPPYTDFVNDVVARGGAAFAHGSGARDLPGRRAHHDLVTGQVRIGTAVVGDRNPAEYRGAGIAMSPDVLGTNVLVMGPGDCAARVVEPVVEAACLQALTGSTAVVAVTSAGSRLADGCFDAVVRFGGPVGLDLWAGTADVDVAAAMLAEALVGDLVDALPGGDSRRAAIALAQLIGPWQAAHGVFPSIPELRDLLDGSAVLAELRLVLESKGMSTHLRELDAHERQARSAGGASALLAERIALLDRPALTQFFTAREEGEEGGVRRLLSLRTLGRPGARIRVDLPERVHAEASRILARLVMAQFVECATDNQQDQDVHALLVLDDGAQTVTPQALRGLQRLAGRAGAVLALRALDDVPERLRSPLVGAFGCRVVCTGVAPWDANLFAEAWGTAWVETRSVTDRQLVADEPFTKVMHGLRRLVTGRAVTAQSVTVRREERQRVSASELTQLPPRHAVISMATVQGERTPPILTRLED